MTTTGDAVHLRTWAGNLTYSARRLVEPESLDDLRRVVAGSSRVRALGTRHSFSAVADTTGDLVGVGRPARRIEVDPERRTATVSAGLRYGEVAPDAARGRAGHWRTWGRCRTSASPGPARPGTHGSGAGNRALASSVAALEFVTRGRRARDADAATTPTSPVPSSRSGALGVVTALTLDVEPTYDVRQTGAPACPARPPLEHVDSS